MTQPNNLSIPATDSLAQLAARIEAWRNDPQKPRRMPEALWQTAAELSKHSSVGHISKALRLDYTALKKRVHAQNKKDLPAVKTQQSLKFIELDICGEEFQPKIASGIIFCLHFDAISAIIPVHEG
jgi:hypothetical protein